MTDRRAALDALLAADAELVMDIDTTAVKSRAALVERVALVIEKADNEQLPDGFYQGKNPEVSDWSAWLATAAINLIRAEVLDEAARELDRWGDIYGDNAAAAIRALKGKQE